MELTALIEDIFQSGQIASALDKGYEPTCCVLSDMLDGMLLTCCPAYAAAMQSASLASDASGAMGGPTIAEIRHRIFIKLADVIGIGDVIRAIIAVWKKIPAALRSALVEGSKNIADLADLLDDPNWQNVSKLASDLGICTSGMASVMGGIKDLDPEEVAEGVRDIVVMASRKVKNVSSVFRSVGLSKLADALDSLPIGADELVAEAIPLLKGVATTVGDVFLDLAKGDIVSAVGDITEEVESIADDAYDDTIGKVLGFVGL